MPIEEIDTPQLAPLPPRWYKYTMCFTALLFWSVVGFNVGGVL